MSKITDQVKKKYSNNVVISKYLEQAIQSLTYEHEAMDSPSTPLFEAIRFDDKEAIGKMVADRIWTLMESDVIGELAYEDDDPYINHLVAQYERTTSIREYSEDI